MVTVTKQYRDLPAAHRQPRHDGHCRLIHGHNWGFDITFACDVLDDNGFVIDVGKLSALKENLYRRFDHTLLLNEDDPLVQDGSAEGQMLRSLAEVVVVPNCGMEGLARYVADLSTRVIQDMSAKHRGLRVVSVTCLEDSKNTATYTLEG